MKTQRSALARGVTFARFAVQQLRGRDRVRREIATVNSAPFTIDAPTISLSANEREWRRTNFGVRQGGNFAVSARGAVWASKALSVVMEPRTSLWVRISGSPKIAKLAANDHVFTAWADGEVEIFLKALSEWASPAGDLLSLERAPTEGDIRVRVAKTSHPETQLHTPPAWQYLWRLGDGAIYSPAPGGQIDISTRGDVGILQTEVDHPITPRTRLEWSWRVDQLPSRLPEDLTLTHDYLSVAVEFDDGNDLTFMWSAGLPRDHIFACPLNFWCDRETHWVVRTPEDGIGQWHNESRSLWDDTQKAYGARPARAVRLWLIANSVFQRKHGSAAVRELKLTEAG